MNLRSLVCLVLSVAISASAVGQEIELPAALRPMERIPESEAVISRMLTLNEYDDLAGKPSSMLLDGKHWHDPV
jgi:spore coat protein A, manganese oxidase